MSASLEAVVQRLTNANRDDGRCADCLTKALALLEKEGINVVDIVHSGDYDTIMSVYNLVRRGYINYVNDRECHESDGSPLEAPYVAFGGRVTSSSAIRGPKRLWPNVGLTNPLPLLPVILGHVYSMQWAPYVGEGTIMPVYGFLLTVTAPTLAFEEGKAFEIVAETSAGLNNGFGEYQPGTRYSMTWYPTRPNASLAFFPISVVDGVSSLHVARALVTHTEAADTFQGEYFSFYITYGGGFPTHSFRMMAAPITDPHAARLLGVASCAPLLATAYSVAQGLPQYAGVLPPVWPGA